MPNKLENSIEVDNATEISSTSTPVTKNEKWTMTLVIYYCHLSLGVSIAFLAPVMIAFSEALETGMQSMSLVLTISRYLGLASGLGFGYLFGFVSRHAVVTVLVFLMSASLFLMPYTGRIEIFGILFAVMNMAIGGYITATSVWVIDLWGNKSGPYIQAQHFFYALGCIIPPTVFAPFLEKAQQKTAENATESIATDHMASVYIPSVICGSIIGIGAILLLVTFLVFKKPSNYQQAKTTDEEPSQNKGTESVEATPSRSKTYIIIAVSSLLIGAVESMELLVTSFLPTYAHYSAFKFTEAEGSRLYSAFQISFTVTRLAGIFLIMKLDPKIMFAINVVVVAIGNILLVAVSSTGNASYLWTAAVLMGAGFATSVPTIFTYLQKNLEISNVVGSVLIVGGAAIASVYPMIVGSYIETFADIVPWLNIGANGASVAIFIALLVLIKGNNSVRVQS